MFVLNPCRVSETLIERDLRRFGKHLKRDTTCTANPRHPHTFKQAHVQSFVLHGFNVASLVIHRSWSSVDGNRPQPGGKEATVAHFTASPSVSCLQPQSTRHFRNDHHHSCTWNVKPRKQNTENMSDHPSTCYGGTATPPLTATPEMLFK